MRKKTFAAPMLLLVLLSTPALAEVPVTAPSGLEALIEEAFNNNKELQALEEKAESLRTGAPAAGALSDPRIGLALANVPTDTFSFNQEAMTQKQLSVSQAVPWFGKLSLAEKNSLMDAVRQERIVEARRNELAKNIAVAWYELGLASESLKINERLAGIMDQILRVAEVKYSTGSGLQQDILSAQVKQTELIDERIELEKQVRTKQAKINELLNRDRAEPIAPPHEVKGPDFDLDEEALEARAVQGNPWTLVRLAEIEQAEIRRELAEKDYYPDMDFKVAYGQRDDDELGNERPDLVSAQVTFSIPLWKKNKQDKKLAAAEKAKSSAVRSYEALVQTLPHQVRGLTAEIEETEKALELVERALMVQAEQWAESSQAAYEVGKIEFDTMIQSNTRLLRLELKALKYRTAINIKRAELEQVLGGPVGAGLQDGREGERRDEKETTK